MGMFLSFVSWGKNAFWAWEDPWDSVSCFFFGDQLINWDGGAL